MLRTLCALHNLEVLRIICCKFATNGDEFESEEETCDEEWDLEDGDVFHSLQFLYLVGLNLLRWRADETNFPRPAISVYTQIN